MPSKCSAAQLPRLRFVTLASRLLAFPAQCLCPPLSFPAILVTASSRLTTVSWARLCAPRATHPPPPWPRSATLWRRTGATCPHPTRQPICRPARSCPLPRHHRACSPRRALVCTSFWCHTVTSVAPCKARSSLTPRAPASLTTQSHLALLSCRLILTSPCPTRSGLRMPMCRLPTSGASSAHPQAPTSQTPISVKRSSGLALSPAQQLFPFPLLTDARFAPQTTPSL
mmetsp:Transcript_10959/g.24926  ORF Transcript_10959/g.24926 Transcript_10959/m.24926 type:complete len:228 (-) Transcript_10959:6079-6762(-)